MDGDSVVDKKPVIESPLEPSPQSDDLKGAEVTERSVESTEQSEQQVKTVSETAPASDDKEQESAEENMEVETTVVETPVSDDPKTAESEPAVEEPAVDDQNKGVEPEPVPEVSVKSPSDVSVNMVSSPAPAVQPSSTPPRSQSAKKPKVDLTTVPVRQYLDTTVVPILLQGLSSLARERPAKPIAYLANFLLDKASEYDE